MLIEILITFIKTISFILTASFAASKIEKSDKKTKKIWIITLGMEVIISIVYANIYSLCKLENYNVAISNLICYTLCILLQLELLNKKVPNNIITGIISITITYIDLFIASIISFIILKIFSIDTNQNTVFEYFIIGIIQIGLMYNFFKIKRFKDGFTFLNSKVFIVIGMSISFILIIFAILIGRDVEDTVVNDICTVIIILGGIAMLEWIKKSITKYYKEKMKDRTVEIQQEQIKEKDKKIDDLQTELSKVLEINHKYNHRLSAMERAVIKLGNEMQANTEFAEEYGDILDSLSELSKEYKAEIESINKTNKLPKTNIFSIDNLLDYMRQEAEKSKIEFKLQIEFDIKEIIENKIPKNKLETLLTDHIRDAIIAIENSENENRKIEVKFSNKEFYQVEFYDTGIEFEIETFLNLGLARTTTHKATGGTGIGFMTTFETLKECKASLEIEEFNNKEYTKAVIIRFDDKNEYRIHSYRAEEIKNKIQDNRIIID